MHSVFAGDIHGIADSSTVDVIIIRAVKQFYISCIKEVDLPIFTESRAGIYAMSILIAVRE
jgi:hypothetical protein